MHPCAADAPGGGRRDEGAGECSGGVAVSDAEVVDCGVSVVLQRRCRIEGEGAPSGGQEEGGNGDILAGLEGAGGVTSCGGEPSDTDGALSARSSCEHSSLTPASVRMRHYPSEGRDTVVRHQVVAPQRKIDESGAPNRIIKLYF